MKFTEFDKIETDRLIIRPFTINDSEDMYEYAKNPNVGPNAGWKPHDNIDETKTIIERFIRESDVMAIEYKSNGKVIGSIGLHNDSKRNRENVKMLGYVLSEDYWGMGLMTECVKAVLNLAFTVMNLEMITVMHFKSNTKSFRVIEKCGFKYEGTLRKSCVIYDGTVLDEVCYSLLCEEWNEISS